MNGFSLKMMDKFTTTITGILLYYIIIISCNVLFTLCCNFKAIALGKRSSALEHDIFQNQVDVMPGKCFLHQVARMCCWYQCPMVDEFGVLMNFSIISFWAMPPLCRDLRTANGVIPTETRGSTPWTCNNDKEVWRLEHLMVEVLLRDLSIDVSFRRQRALYSSWQQ